MREPLLLPLIAFACGIVLDWALGFSPLEAAWPGVAFVALAALPCGRWLRVLNVGLALVFAGAFASAWHQPRQIPVIDADPREMVVAQGCVVEPTVFSNDRAQFTLELEPGARVHVQVPSYAKEAVPPEFTYGQRVEIEARFRAPHNFNNPGAFDYAAYLARQHIFWTALVPSRGTARVLPGRCGSTWRAWIFALRTAALRRIDRLYPDNDYASGMLEAVLIGESTKLERVWTEDFRRSGTYHALVISGLHVSVLAGVLLLLLRFVPVSATTALALTACAAWLYALVSGFSVPVARAAAGFTLYLIARLIFRRVRPLNLLAAIALVFLAWDPPQLYEASFQLSFLSIAAIAVLGAPILERTTQPLSRAAREITNLNLDPHVGRAAQLRVELRLAAETVALWTPIPLRFASRALALMARVGFFAAELGMISLAVQVGLALPMAEYFHRISFTGLSANVLIVPLMNTVVPVGFLALFTGWHWVAVFADALLRWSARIAAWHAALEPAWRVPDPPVWLAGLLVVALVGAGVVIRRTAASKGKRLLSFSVIIVLIAVIALIVRSPWPPAIQPKTLELTAIDVGQGDSLLLIFPEGKTMLIDGGGRLEYGTIKRRSNLDIGEDVVSSYLWTRGIRRIDILVATHAHQDHIGGLPALLENFQPTELWTGANPPPRLVAEARSMGVRVSEKKAAEPFLYSGAQIEILSPTRDYIPTAPGNNDSLVMRVSFGSRAFLLTGDMEAPVERALLEANAVRPADVLKLGHHGSRTSTTQEFLDAVAPAIAVVSAGFENSFGHPHPDVLHRLEARHSTILRTDLEGLATVRTDGQHLLFDIDTWHSEDRRMLFPEHLLH
ncbi:MAG: ComEC/Rec2 family competence protein [Acidobacteriota bacterium]